MVLYGAPPFSDLPLLADFGLLMRLDHTLLSERRATICSGHRRVEALHTPSRVNMVVSTRVDGPLARGREEGGVMAKSGKSNSGSSRSSITGKFVTSKYAKSHPSTTQTSHKKSK